MSAPVSIKKGRVPVATAPASGVRVCQSNRGENLIQFNGRNQDIFFPCKYWALHRQQCGKYIINLSPGNRWIFPKYQLDTIWLAVENSETGKVWEGRTTNKLAVKFFNSAGQRDLFNKKDGSVATSDVFEFGKDEGVGVFIKDKEDTFKVTFTPWDPSNRKAFPNSDWKFECFDENAPLTNEYPAQLCGGEGKRLVMTRAKEDFDLPNRFRMNAIYFDTLTNPDIVHTNPKCTNATDILLNTCQSDAQRLLVINNCKTILHDQRHTECVTNYNCDPMDVFNACVMWGCTGTGFDPANKAMCHEVAEGIDFCPEFAQSGNLSARVEAANCYKDFLKIDV
ncbi:hypothetical protein V1264_015388 [Littorina saxatilis]|uniref:Uncharacterized protein n=1 Tax=Littorina saxatilis TaxID=31220 RepID=A0AAN9GGY0_9CAEN